VTVEMTVTLLLQWQWTKCKLKWRGRWNTRFGGFHMGKNR
jgi:hypothetical protein